MKKQLLVYGSGRHTVPFLRYMANATNKETPNMCFIPTASGEDQAYIDSFYEVCSQINVFPHVMSVWINSYDQKESFDELISKMDAIVVGGGNTLNMLAIWKAQGIDIALKKAYNKGVVMGGGSAGSLCWDSSIKAIVRITIQNRTEDLYTTTISFPANYPPVMPVMTDAQYILLMVKYIRQSP